MAKSLARKSPLQRKTPIPETVIARQGGVGGGSKDGMPVFVPAKKFVPGKKKQ